METDKNSVGIMKRSAGSEDSSASPLQSSEESPSTSNSTKKARTSDAATPDVLVPVLLWSDQVKLNEENPIKMANFIRSALQVKDINGKKGEKSGIIIIPATMEQQEKLLQIKNLGEFPVFAEIPGRYLFVKGIVKGVHSEVTEAELLDWIREKQHSNITEVRFLKSKNQNNASRHRRWTALLTFSGRELPKEVFIGYEGPFAIQRYTSKPKQCLKCYGYAHVRSNCRNETRCPNCGEDHEVTECRTTTLSCPNCQQAHVATDPKCPTWIRQKRIIDLMQGQDISYREAAREVREAERTNDSDRATSSMQSQIDELKSRVVNVEASMHNQFEDLQNAYKESFRTLSNKLDELFDLVLQFMVIQQSRSEPPTRRHGE